MSDYDVVVIGGGHNGLTAANYLALKGRKVIVCEASDRLGGLAAREEFHPGFHSSGVWQDTTGLRRWVANDLKLSQHGLRFCNDSCAVFAPARQGKGLLLWDDADRAEEEIGPLAQKDVAAYRDYRKFCNRISPLLRKVFDDFPPDITAMTFPGLWDLFKKGLSLRMLGRADMMEVLRIGPMCVADWLNEWFSSDLLKAVLAGPAIYSTYTGPWSPGSNANLLLYEGLREAPVVGGAQAVTAALVAAAKANGVELKVGSRVQKVVIEDQVATGVLLADGTELRAARVAASCDPKTLFLDMIDNIHLSQQCEQNALHYRARGTTAKIDLALREYPDFACRPGLKADFFRTGEDFDEQERAFDAVKYRQFSDRPIIEGYVPTLECPDLAPEGQHVMQLLVHFAPYELEGGWTDARHQQLLEQTLTTLQDYMPDLKSLVVGSRIMTPADIAARYGTYHGHLHHGEHAADQLLIRPMPECSRYATPFEGLYLCGSGSHPGGGLTCAPGALAAKAIFS